MYVQQWDTPRVLVITGLEIHVLSALRGLSVKARWTFSFASPAPGEGLHGGPLKGSCGPASSQRYANTAKRRRARLLVYLILNMKRSSRPPCRPSPGAGEAGGHGGGRIKRKN